MKRKKEGQKRMKILSITAQKPHSTGSGVYLTELVKNWAEAGDEQSVVGGVYEEDQVDFPDGVKFYPVFYHTEALPFAITGMSDEMPYESTCYKAVSYTHLDVYKRQDIRKGSKNVCEKLERFHARFSYQKKRITNEKFEKKERGIWKKKEILLQLL